MKKLPIGISDFQKIRVEDYFYVDKTLLIDELWRASGEVILMPRPRRFGKTLNLSMLRYFFQKSEESLGYLFHGTNIWKLSEYHALQGTYPVIFLSFKDIKEETFDGALNKFGFGISREFGRHRYLLHSEYLRPEERAKFEAILHEKSSKDDLSSSLKLLSELLERHHNSKVIVLIDEYDTPIHAAYSYKYYKEMVNFVRSLLTAVLKDNTSIGRGFLTGILRTAKEGIFSGLNNLDVFSLLSTRLSDKFGFTTAEVDALLDARGLSSKSVEIKAWYNSYRCRSVSLYNPWSLLKCVDDNGALRPYWVNTSDNALIKELIAHADTTVKEEFELLIGGSSIVKEVNEAFVFPDMSNNSTILWSLLLFSGYVTYTDHELINGKDMCTLIIPNKEIALLYGNLVQEIIKGSLREPQIVSMLDALVSGNKEIFGALLHEFIINSMSVYDISDKEPERSYHLFVLGLLVLLNDSYEILSNRESGYGRYDIMLVPRDLSKSGIVIEFKKALASQGESLENAADKALEQIEEKKYEQSLRAKGIQKIFCYGIGISGKNVLVKMTSK